jgi:hypothetical protein
MSVFVSTRGAGAARFGKRRQILLACLAQLAGLDNPHTMLVSMRLLSRLGFGALVLFGSSAALGQTDLERATAREAATSGRAAFDAGQYEKAIDQFSRAEQLVHAPPHLLFLARSQAKVGRLVAAHETYLKITRESLKPGTPQVFSDAQASAVQELPALDARLPYVTVTLHGAAADGVTIDMDGTILPTAMIGIPLMTDPGRHVFKASGTATSDPVTVTVAEAAKQSVVLEVQSAGVSATPPVTTGAGSAALSSSDPLADDRSQHGSSLRLASYVSFGVGAVGLGVGTYFLLKSTSTNDEAGGLFDRCVGIDRSGNCGPLRAEYDAKHSDAKSQRNIGIASTVVGGVGVAAGITLLILDANRAQKSAHETTPHVTPVFGFNSVGLLGTF